MIDLVLYGRRECHLCDDMKQVVEAASAGFATTLSIVDVDDDPELAARYGEEVPVLLVNGRKAAKFRVSAWRLRLSLAAAHLAGDSKTR